MAGISIKYVDHMGDDFRVFEAAKATMGGKEEGGWCRECTDPTRLITFLAKNKHKTPFRHPQVTFECEAPIAIARQLGKHQVGFSWNERSMRYRDTVVSMYEPDVFRGRPDSLHDGSTEVDVQFYPTPVLSNVGFNVGYLNIKDAYKEAMDWAIYYYDSLLKAGLAPEQARFVLPQGMITRWMWTGSLYGWYEVWRQRHDKHAQYEAQLFAKLLDEKMSGLFPIAWTALKSGDLND